MSDRANEFNRLFEDLKAGRVDRRAFLKRGAALGVSALALGNLAKVAEVGAQDATPASGASPMAGGTGQVVKSITREEYRAQIDANYTLTEGQPGGQVLLGGATDIKTVNGMLGSDSPTLDYTAFIHETLIGTSIIDGSPVPLLADSWEIAADGKTYTFYLNPDATWHDGTPFTADDVVFSIDAQLNPETGSEYTTGNADVIESYRAIDEKTVEVVSVDPIVSFLYGDFYVPIVPKHIWEGVTSWAEDPGSTGQDPARVVGTGPMKFLEWVQGDHLTLVRNDNYYDTITAKVPYIDELTYQVLPDDVSEVQALKTGEIDIIERVSAPQVEEVKNSEGLAIITYDTFDFGWYGYNLDPAKTTLFQDVEVRQALIHALDRDAINENIYLGYGETAIGTQATLSPSYAPEEITNKYEFDPEKAVQLLESAGWVEGEGGVREKDGQALSFALTYPSGTSTTDQMVAFIQESWAAVGAEVELNGIPFDELVTVLTETHDYDIILLGFSWGPSGNQDIMFGCASYEGGFNTMKYCNEEYDRLHQEMIREFDDERRREMQIQLSNMVNDDAPIGIIRFTIANTGHNVRLKNYYANDFGFLWSIPWVYIQE